MAEKLRLYIDMDNVIVDFMSGVERVEPAVLESHYKLHGQDKNLDEIEGVFALGEARVANDEESDRD